MIVKPDPKKVFHIQRVLEKHGDEKILEHFEDVISSYSHLYEKYKVLNHKLQALVKDTNYECTEVLG